ncbi:hypothetical protein PG995_009629 [Apiospora arundinis]
MAQQGNPLYSGSATAQTRHSLLHKVSEISDGPYDEEHLPRRIRGRDSLVSLQSHHDESSLRIPSQASGLWSTPLRSPAGYQPVDRNDDSPPKAARNKSFRVRSQHPIVEDEGYDMSLLKAAAPMAGSDSRPTENEEVYGTLYDVTSFSGPMGAQDEEFLRSLQKQEASGKLTGGIGAGDVPRTQIKSDMLLATSPMTRSFSRSLTLKRKATTKKDAIKGLGQNEANKTGAVIEVIIEDPMDKQSGVDLSNMVGPTPLGTDPNRMRQTTFPKSNKSTEIFYPQPNWKPFSMRWPYLIVLILLSLILAIGVELIYQSSTRVPLMRFNKPGDINPFDYFVLRFVPTLVTVTYGVFWQITDVEVRRLEAFYQMSKDGGALAAESINVDYITSFSFSRPIRAFQRKHYAVAVSSIATLLAVSLVPTLGAASIVMLPDRATRQTGNVEKTIIMSAVLSRLLTSTFVIIAALGCILFYQLHSRRSGLLADVKGIAGLAAMAVVSHVMMDFKDMDVAKPKDIHKKLKNHRYVLRNSSLAPDDSTSTTAKDTEKHKEIDVSENPHPLMLRAEGGVPFIIGILLFLVFLPIVLFTKANELTDKAPWVITALAVSIKLAWGSLETSIRMMEPYYILSKRHAPAKTLTLDYTAMPFAWVALAAFVNRHWMVFLVGFGTVLAETLTILMTSLATVSGRDFLEQASLDHDSNDSPRNLRRAGNKINAGQETVVSFTVSLTLTCFILVYMFVVATIVFVRRRHPFLPRQPNTISSVLAFMHQSKMLYDFVGTAKFTNAQMVQRLEGLGKTYGLGWFEGRDGQTHCGVDEEELTGSYKHGIDYSRGNKPWDREWQLF